MKIETKCKCGKNTGEKREQGEEKKNERYKYRGRRENRAKRKSILKQVHSTLISVPSFCR